MIRLESRASAVLYHFLVSQDFEDPFLLPANVCPIVPMVFLKAGVDIEFVDIGLNQAMDSSTVLKRIRNDSFSGVFFVHSYGKLFDIEESFGEIKSVDDQICIVDDRCLCPPDTSLSKPGIADLILYSTGYSKYVDLSCGGWGVLNDDCDYRRSILDFKLPDLQVLQKRHKDCLENESRFEDEQLDWLDTSSIPGSQESFFHRVDSALESIAVHKAKLNELYANELPVNIQFPVDYNQWRFNIRVDERAPLLKAITDKGLFAGSNFPSVSGMFGGGNKSNAIREGRHIMNLFNDFRFDEEKGMKICEVIRRYV